MMGDKISMRSERLTFEDLKTKNMVILEGVHARTVFIPEHWGFLAFWGPSVCTKINEKGSFSELKYRCEL